MILKRRGINRQWLTQLLISHFGKPVTTNVTIRFGTVNDRTVARIDVAPAPEPVYTLLTKTTLLAIRRSGCGLGVA